MNMGQAISSGFKRYVDFEGRSSRSEYWWWTLSSAILSTLAQVLTIDASTDNAGLAVVLLLVVFLALFLPGLAVTVRRLHDLDRSGWWIFISLVPIVGGIILIVWFCTKGTEGPNRFGFDPLA